MTRIGIAGGFAAFALVAGVAWAKIPPPPPLDEKGKAAADKAKADQAAAEDYAVKNYQSNMKKAGKPIPKATPLAVAPVAPAAAVKPAEKAPEKVPAKDAAPKKS